MGEVSPTSPIKRKWQSVQTGYRRPPSRSKTMTGRVIANSTVTELSTGVNRPIKVRVRAPTVFVAGSGARIDAKNINYRTVIEVQRYQPHDIDSVEKTVNVSNDFYYLLGISW
jgi:hypothetical protein